MVRHFLCLCVALWLVPAAMFAQKTKTVEGEYTYYAPENVTLEEARRTALERAKIQALADAFGTVVQQSNTTRVENSNGESKTDFLSIGSSDVRGEWIETIGEPHYDIFYEQGMLVVKATVRGRAREITSAAIDLKIKVLRNGTDDKFESDTFRDGDDLYLSFQSPIKGYLAVYLLDEETMEASCLLPYNGTGAVAYPINDEEKYILFSLDNANKKDKAYVRQYYLQCKKQIEYNTLYVIFSSSKFTICEAEGNNSEIRVSPYNVFNKWLINMRNKCKDINVRTIPIKIEKNQE